MFLRTVHMGAQHSDDVRKCFTGVGKSGAITSIGTDRPTYAVGRPTI